VVEDESGRDWNCNRRVWWICGAAI
jgi:hypothetical protein